MTANAALSLSPSPERAKRFQDGLHHIGMTLLSDLDFTKSMRQVMMEASLLFENDSHAISLRRREGFEAHIVDGLPDMGVGTRLEPVVEPHAELALSTRQVQFIEDAWNDPRTNNEHMRRWNVRSVIVIPLVARAKELGVVFFCWHTGPVGFDDLIRDAANKICALLTLALAHMDAVSEVKAEQARSDAILTSISDDFYVLDRNWNFVYTNRHFTSKVGKEPQDFIGNCIWAMFPKHLGTEYEENVRAAMERREIRRFEVTGKYTNAVYRMTVFPSGEGVTVLGHEITDQKRAEAALKRLAEDLEARVEERTAELTQAYKELEAFSYSVSHDLRAPLRIINGFAALLARRKEHQLSPEEQTAIATIQEQAVQMDGLVKALLEFSRLLRKDFKRVPVDTRRMVEQVVAEQRQVMGGEAGDRVQIRIGELPTVAADPVLLRMVFTNLLANAFKFTRTADQPTVTVEAQMADGVYVFRVADNGVGFPKGQRDKLFGVFQRLHGPGEFEGTGIGLATVRKIIERHGGRVCGDGEEGKGAVFAFTLPAGAADPGGEE